MLLISRIAGKMDGMGGFTPAGSAVNRQMLRFERRGDRIMLRKHYGTAVADDTLAIAASVEANYFAPILASWDIEARGPDSTSSVIDVTDFFGGDTPSISGLSSFQRRDYAVRRLDADRSFISRMRSYPLNVNVRHTLTWDAGSPPNDALTNTVSLEMNQSLVLLPAEADAAPLRGPSRRLTSASAASTTASTSRRPPPRPSSAAGAWSPPIRRRTRAARWSIP